MEQGPGEDPEGLRQSLLAELTEAVAQEDYSLVNQIAGGQALLRPAEIALQMNDARKRDALFDEVTGARWEAALWGYLDTIDEQELSGADKEAVRKVKVDLRAAEFERIALKEEPFYAPEAYGPEPEEEIEHWELTEFEVEDIDKETFDRIRSSRIFHLVEVQAEAGHFDRAVNIILITPFMSAEEKYQARKVLDGFLSDFCEEAAANGYLEDATRDINMYASDEYAARRLRSSLDRFVYAAAEQQAAYGNLDVAQGIIKRYASSLARCDAMLRRLSRYGD